MCKQVVLPPFCKYDVTVCLHTIVFHLFYQELLTRICSPDNSKNFRLMSYIGNNHLKINRLKIEELESKCIHISLPTADLPIISSFLVCVFTSCLNENDMTTNSKNTFSYGQITLAFISYEENKLRENRNIPCGDAYFLN